MNDNDNPDNPPKAIPDVPDTPAIPDVPAKAEYIDEPKKLTLDDFPPTLRRIAIASYLDQQDLPLHKLADKIGVDRKTVYQEIYRAKKNGRDFYRFINQEVDEIIRGSRFAVDLKTLEQALEGTAKDRELYYRRLGLLKDTVQHEHSHRHIHLHHSSPLPVQPEAIEASDESD
jgi:hypothetical protein